MTATDQTFVEAPSVADGIILTDEAAGKGEGAPGGRRPHGSVTSSSGSAGRLLWSALPALLRRAQPRGRIVKEFGGVNVVTDRMSAPYPMGATIDFMDTIEKQGFTIDNPNATGSCACGDSFH